MHYVTRVIQPTVSLNGTSPEVLIEGLMNCKVRIDHAVDALRNAMPHGRDYLDADQLQKARRAWLERIQAFNLVAEEVENLAIEVQKRD